jgi:hypothetical protein
MLDETCATIPLRCPYRKLLPKIKRCRQHNRQWVGRYSKGIPLQQALPPSSKWHIFSTGAEDLQV